MNNHIKIALVTGASSNIGKTITQSLLAAHFKVIAQVNTHREALCDLEPSPNLTILQHDLASADLIRQFVQAATTRFQHLDALINTIGPLLLKNIDLLTPIEWEQQIHFNLNLNFHLSYFLKDQLIQSKGQIINFGYAGVEGLRAHLDAAPYGAAKAGLVVLTKTLASWLAPHGVRVNAISPGLIEEAAAEGSEREAMAAAIPLGRKGSPQEVAELLVWILTESPSYLTGSVLPMAGAWEF